MAMHACAHGRFADTCNDCKIRKLEEELCMADELADQVRNYTKEPIRNWNNMYEAMIQYRKARGLT